MSCGDTLLSHHVTLEGRVNYKGFIKDSILFTTYLRLLSDHHPNDKNWTVSDQKAFWINAYNAFTIKLIIDNYPLQSIKDIGSSIQIPFVNSPWDIKFIQIQNKKYDLNNIEHDILRSQFKDPRIHFAIVCASKSCPKLRNKAFSSLNLESQLNDQAIAFINDFQKNVLNKDQIRISKIFAWFKKDFTEENKLIDFINIYANTTIPVNVTIEYLDYNWALNE